MTNDLDPTETAKSNPIANSELALTLSEIRELDVLNEDSPISQKGESNWLLDPNEEDDRKAIAIFELAGLQPQNRFHRDLLLEILLDHVAFRGAPSWTEQEQWALLKDVHYTRKALRHMNKQSGLLDACEEIACQEDLEGKKLSPKTLKRRYFEARSHFLRRRNTESFVRDWPPPCLSQLDTVLNGG